MNLFHPRKAPVSLLLAALLSSSVCAAQQGSGAAAPAAQGARGPTAPAIPQHPKPLLPPAFAGQPRAGNIVTQPTAADVDPAHAGALKEDGFVQASSAHYAGTGPTGWGVQVMRFGDATGAYSAFTFYRDPAMQPEAVGDDAAASPDLFLVRSNATLVRVRAAGLRSGGAQDATRLRTAMLALVQGLPRVQGPEAIAPSLPGLMPADGLQKQTLHYAIGPASYSGPLPVAAIDFSRDAEAATARYRLHSGASATLTLLMLPTPQIAGSSLREIEALPDAPLHIAARRYGPLVGVVSGAGASQADAQQLLSQIHYRTDLTLDQPQGYVSEVAKAAKLLLGIAYLTAILAIAAVVIAVFLGAGRVAVRRMRGKPDSSLNDEEFITLKL